MSTRVERERWIREDDPIRSREYLGVDKSGYEWAPRWGEAGGVRHRDYVEASPGNVGEPGGRWHDHEMPYVHEDGASAGASASSAAPDERFGGFLPEAIEIYSGGYLGAFAYGHGGREGAAPAAAGTRGGPGGKPRTSGG